MSEHFRVMTNSSIIIHRVASILEENGLSTLIKDNTESARLAGFGTPQNNVDLYVKESDLKRAKEIIDDFKNNMAV
jgi:hypothetical protein